MHVLNSCFCRKLLSIRMIALTILKDLCSLRKIHFFFFFFELTELTTCITFLLSEFCSICDSRTGTTKYNTGTFL